MFSDIDKHLQKVIFEPLNRMLDGQFPDLPVPYYINSYPIKYLFDEEFYVEHCCDTIEYTESIEDTVISYRSGIYAPNVSKVLMPLYRELLFEPSKRMLFLNKKLTHEDKRKLLRFETTCAIREMLAEDKYVAQLFDGMTLIEAIEKRIALGVKDYDMLFLKTLVAAIENGYTTDWNELYEKIKPELKSLPENFIKLKVEYCCMLMAVIMIMRNNEIEEEKRNKLLEQLCDGGTWDVIAYQYSVLLDAMINSEFNNSIQVIRLFADSKKRYAHLLLACVNHKFSVGKTPNLDYYKQQKFNDAYRKLKEACNSYQEEDLDDLFHVIFPDAICREYSKDTHRITTAEKQKIFEAQKKRNEELTQRINALNVEIEELRVFRDMALQMERDYTQDMISVDDLKGVILSIKDAEKAQQFYFYLNYYLMENENWMKHACEIKHLLDDKLDQKNVTMNFNSPVGQAIGNVDTIINKEDTK